MVRESRIEKRLREAVELIGGKAPKWVSPGNNGVPDRIVLLPNGRIYFVELKAPGQPMRPLQKKWRRDLIDMGYVHVKIDSIHDLEKFIQEVSDR